MIPKILHPLLRPQGRSNEEVSNSDSVRRVVVITGAARGIGYAIAMAFVREGATIAILDLDGKAAIEAAHKLEQIRPTGSIGFACDVANRADIAKALDALISRLGRIDVLVNNAGVCPFVDVMDLTPETWSRTIEVNLSGAFHCSQMVARQMISQGTGGRIIFITSLGENVINPSQVDYGASKGGMRMLMVGFATALGKFGITCNAVAPGIILTDMSASYWTQEEPARQIQERVPVGRIGTPEDVAHAVVFLASPQADYISGVSLRVDGGHQTRAV